MRRSSATRPNAVAITPTCTECDAVWLPADPERWQAHRIDDPFDEHDPPAIAFYCLGCALREFGD